MRFLISCLIFLGLSAIAVSSAAVASDVPNELQGVGITEHLNGAVSIQNLTFKDETGKNVHLADYFHKGHPVLLTLVYYECPNLCNYLLNGLVKSLQKLDWTPGKQFDIVTVSFNPKEGPELAARKKAAYIASYGNPAAAAGWHFLTGQEDQISQLAKEVGFGYRYDSQEKQFAHTTLVTILTPEGKISRYLYGIDFPKQDLRLALLEASNGKIGTIVDRVLLFCYHFDPKTGKYSVVISRVMTAACTGTVVIFGGYLVAFWRRQRFLPNSDDDHAKKGA